jgi:hypothetical protein
MTFLSLSINCFAFGPGKLYFGIKRSSYALIRGEMLKRKMAMAIAFAFFFFEKKSDA